MADIKQIHVNDATYDFKDEVARNGLNALTQEVEGKQSAITTVTASVDSNVGTPSVTPIWNNGTLDFAFHNVKGEQGIQGIQGPQGDSVLVGAGDLPLAHVLGDDNTKAMSQKGVTDIANDALGYTEAEVVELELSDADKVANVYLYESPDHDFTWVSSTHGVQTAAFFELKKYQNVKIVANAEYSTYALVSTTNCVAGTYVSFADGHEGLVSMEGGSTVEFIVDDDCYLYIFALNNSGISRFPQLLEVKGDGSYARIDTIEERLDALEHGVSPDNGKPMVGAIYFDGWSNPNQVTNAHMRKGQFEWEGRKPLWGWFAHKTRKCDEWLESPVIELPQASDITLNIEHLCVLWDDESQCEIHIRDINDEIWEKLVYDLPDTETIDFDDTEIDISNYAGKSVQIGFRLRVKGLAVSPVWELKSMSIDADGITVFSRDFQSTTDFFTTDADIWKPCFFGYNGNSYDTYDADGIIDHEIEMAAGANIDYFNFCFYPCLTQDGVDPDACKAEVRHRSMYSFIRSSHKYKMKWCLWIINGGQRVITSLAQWKGLMDFVAENYLIDGQYLTINGKPVIYIYVNDSVFSSNFSALDTYVKEELGYEFIWIINGVNTNYATGQSGSYQEYPYSTLTSRVVTSNNALTGNIVPTVMVGWDMRPWEGEYYGDISHQWLVGSKGAWFTHNEEDLPIFADSITTAMTLVKGKNQEFKSIILYAWNEVCEGGFLMPIGNDPSGKWLRTLKETIDNYD